MKTPSLLSDSELEAALAEVESDAGKGIPSLDDPNLEGVAVPVPAGEPVPASPPPLAPPSLIRKSKKPVDPPPPSEPARTRLLKRCKTLALRALEQVMILMDRPFRWVPQGVRTWIGYAALTSVACSLVALFLFPLIAPRITPADRLRNQVKALEDARDADDAGVAGAAQDSHAAAKH